MALVSKLISGAFGRSEDVENLKMLPWFFDASWARLGFLALLLGWGVNGDRSQFRPKVQSLPSLGSSYIWLEVNGLNVNPLLHFWHAAADGAGE